MPKPEPFAVSMSGATHTGQYSVQKSGAGAAMQRSGLLHPGSAGAFIMNITPQYELIKKDTANAQGDFARTSDGLANSTKTLNARMSDLTVQLGKMLEGPAQGFVGFLSDVAEGILNPTGASPARSGTAAPSSSSTPGASTTPTRASTASPKERAASCCARSGWPTTTP